ncbi:RcnB family protein [Janthinobacterium sp. PSPC3-1]|uniref:RcnB family protein n=1 Tax=Janthinobacterium sp. PSPC3-1 TaxID=2804653 RepID=UPI003CEBDBB3
MKSKMIVSALIAISIAASGSALAQRGNDNHDRNDHNDRNDHGQQHEQHDSDGRHDDARKFKRDDSRGGGPKHDLRRGQRLSQEYRDKRYVVNDWKARHLNAPPRGHQWVRAGNDYVLAAIATGVITQILLSN